MGDVTLPLADGYPINQIEMRSELQWPRRWLEAALALLFPPHCAGCGQTKTIWCPECDRTLRRLSSHLCPQCGLPLRSRSTCLACSRHSLPLKVRSYATYEGPLGKALLQLKYSPNRLLAFQMSQWLAELLSRESWPVDLVVPVPLGKDRLRQRGYNQAGLIASELAKSQHLPYSNRALWRVRETLSQVGLDAIARMKNVRGAFSADSAIVGGKRVMIVDDLYTTGATLSSCAQALLQVGAVEVFGLTVGRAYGDIP